MARATNPVPLLLHAILAQGATSPTHERLAEVAGISDRSIDHAITRHRAIRGLVGGRGAKLGPGLGLVVALSLGAESLRAGLVDANGDVRASVSLDPLPDQLALPPDRLTARIREAAARSLTGGLSDELLWSGDRASLRLLGVAVAWPSPVDREKRPRGRALRDPAWTRANRHGRVVPLTERVADAMGGPFTVERTHALNDVNAQALAYAFRWARLRALEEEDDRWRVTMVVRVGGGLGAGVVLLAPHTVNRLSFIESRLIGGANGLAGELGHAGVDRKTVEDRNDDDPHGLAPLDFDSWRCSCGRLHHLEAFASGTALVQRLQESGYEIPDEQRGRTSLIRALLDGDTDDVQAHAVKDVGRLLGRALGPPVLMLDPDSITLTGSLACEHLKQGVNAERDVWGHAIGDAARVSYIAGDEGAFLGVRGAALAVLRRRVYRCMDDGVVRIRSASFEFGPNDLRRLLART